MYFTHQAGEPGRSVVVLSDRAEFSSAAASSPQSQTPDPRSAEATTAVFRWIAAPLP